MNKHQVAGEWITNENNLFPYVGQQSDLGNASFPAQISYDSGSITGLVSLYEKNETYSAVRPALETLDKFLDSKKALDILRKAGVKRVSPEVRDAFDFSTCNLEDESLYIRMSKTNMELENKKERGKRKELSI